MAKLKHKLTKENLLNGFFFIIGFGIFCVVNEMSYQDAIEAEKRKAEFHEHIENVKEFNSYFANYGE